MKHRLEPDKLSIHSFITAMLICLCCAGAGCGSGNTKEESVLNETNLPASPPTKHLPANSSNDTANTSAPSSANNTKPKDQGDPKREPGDAASPHEDAQGSGSSEEENPLGKKEPSIDSHPQSSHHVGTTKKHNVEV